MREMFHVLFLAAGILFADVCRILFYRYSHLFDFKLSYFRKNCDGTVLSPTEIIYDVFLPDSKFKKSNPGKPDHRIFVAR